MITVCLHGWHWYAWGGDQCQTYADMDDKPEGYCVYTRTDTGDDDEPFDIDDEKDFTDLAAAQQEAQNRAERLGVEVTVY